MSDPLGSVTLGDLIRADKLLWIYCRECHHKRTQVAFSASNDRCRRLACRDDPRHWFTGCLP